MPRRMPLPTGWHRQGQRWRDPYGNVWEPRKASHLLWRFTADDRASSILVAGPPDCAMDMESLIVRDQIAALGGRDRAPLTTVLAALEHHRANLCGPERLVYWALRDHVRSRVYLLTFVGEDRGDHRAA